MLTIARPLTLVVAAIIAVAAWTLPSAALAHAGQDHRHHAATTGDTGQHTAPAATASDATSQFVTPVSRPAMVTSMSGESDAVGSCGGASCCGVAGAGCCGGLLGTSQAAIPAPTMAAGMLGPAPPGLLAGSGPDTLLKPPKSFV
jgi:hypothetical protein